MDEVEFHAPSRESKSKRWLSFHPFSGIPSYNYHKPELSKELSRSYPFFDLQNHPVFLLENPLTVPGRRPADPRKCSALVWKVPGKTARDWISDPTFWGSIEKMVIFHNPEIFWV